MTGPIILGCVVALIVFLLFSRARVTVTWDGKLTVTAGYLFIKKNITDLAKKEAKGEKKQKPEKKRRKEKKKEQEPVVSDVRDIISLIKEVVFTAGKRFLRYLRIDAYRFDLTVGTGDAAKTAVVYGAASAAVFSLSEALYSRKGRNLGAERFSASVVPDFTAEKSTVYVCVGASIRVYQAIICLVSGGMGFMRYYGKKQTDKDKVKEDDNGRNANEKDDRSGS